MDIESIVAACQNGDRDAFGVLYRTYSLPMSGVIGRYVHNQEIAKDILHDGFIVAFTSISTLKEGTKVEAWLTTIMKNLSLQYLRKESGHISVPVSETAITNESAEDGEEIDLSWKQLEGIINRLPEGYGKVFRLNVLDGLSHKEIAGLLGISPLTSASQLHHAKALLRRMINEYRVEIGGFAVIVGIAISLHYLLNKTNFQRSANAPSVTPAGIADNNVKPVVSVAKGSIVYNNPGQSTGALYLPKSSQLGDKRGELEDSTAVDSLERPVSQDIVPLDSTIIVPSSRVEKHLLADSDNGKRIYSHKESKWTLSIVFSGTVGNTTTSHYGIPDIGSGDPDGYMEEIRNVRCHVPITFGVSFSKNITNRWSIASGLRYTYLRTDETVDNKFSVTESVQKLHYLGIPLKVNYTIFAAERFSLYGQGGIALDIPLNGTLWKKENLLYEESSHVNENRLNVPLQWSVEAGIGMQYQLIPSISIYAEPSFRYYFNPNGDISTIRQQKPLELTIPIGIRMTW